MGKHAVSTKKLIGRANDLLKKLEKNKNTLRNVKFKHVYFKEISQDTFSNVLNSLDHITSLKISQVIFDIQIDPNIFANTFKHLIKLKLDKSFYIEMQSQDAYFQLLNKWNEQSIGNLQKLSLYIDGSISESGEKVLNSVVCRSINNILNKHKNSLTKIMLHHKICDLRSVLYNINNCVNLNTLIFINDREIKREQIEKPTTDANLNIESLRKIIIKGYNIIDYNILLTNYNIRYIHLEYVYVDNIVYENVVKFIEKSNCLECIILKNLFDLPCRIGYDLISENKFYSFMEDKLSLRLKNNILSNQTLIKYPEIIYSDLMQCILMFNDSNNTCHPFDTFLNKLEDSYKTQIENIINSNYAKKQKASEKILLFICILKRLNYPKDIIPLFSKYIWNYRKDILLENNNSLIVEKNNC